ncbi:MAG TPA: hypothetical protein VFX33_14115 [Actinomycetales bacterium]|nr:hypothetical protein [Actinomycetales bacterium]
MNGNIEQALRATLDRQAPVEAPAQDWDGLWRAARRRRIRHRIGITTGVVAVATMAAGIGIQASTSSTPNSTLAATPGDDLRLGERPTTQIQSAVEQALKREGILHDTPVKWNAPQEDQLFGAHLAGGTPGDEPRVVPVPGFPSDGYAATSLSGFVPGTGERAPIQVIVSHVDRQLPADAAYCTWFETIPNPPGHDLGNRPCLMQKMDDGTLIRQPEKHQATFVWSAGQVQITEMSPFTGKPGEPDASLSMDQLINVVTDPDLRW